MPRVRGNAVTVIRIFINSFNYYVINFANSINLLHNYLNSILNSENEITIEDMNLIESCLLLKLIIKSNYIFRSLSIWKKFDYKLICKKVN